MLDEIEKFLRQAAAKRQAQKQPQARPRPPMPAEVVAPELIVYDDIEVGADVGDHVAQHMNTGEFTERASHLGERVGQADDKMEAHLEQKFDHKLGKLQDTSQGAKEFHHEESGAPKPTTPSMTTGNVLQLLRQPESLRQAIIVSEILKRPEMGD